VSAGWEISQGNYLGSREFEEIPLENKKRNKFAIKRKNCFQSA